MKSTNSSCIEVSSLACSRSTGGLLQMNGKPAVVVVENELLAGGGAVEAELSGRDDLRTRPGAQALRLRPSVERLERDIDVLELLCDGRHVEAGPAARPVRVV